MLPLQPAITAHAQFNIARERDKVMARATAKATAAAANGEDVTPSRQKHRSRGWSVQSILTPFRSSKDTPESKERHTKISKESISHPILLNSPKALNLRATDRGQVSQLSAQPQPRTPIRPAPPSPFTPTSSNAFTDTQYTLKSRDSASASERVQGAEFPLCPASIDLGYLRPYLSDPSHSHAYPKSRPRLSETHHRQSPVPSQLRITSVKKPVYQESDPQYQGLFSPKSTPYSVAFANDGPGPTIPTSPLIEYPQPRTPISTKHSVQRFDSGFGEACKGKSEHTVTSVGIASVPSFGRNRDRLSEIRKKKLSRISESSQEPAFEPVQRASRQLTAVAKMEFRASLQPPPNVGTKGRAIQQAKEMEMLVAERAKRSGDEPPPYDFIELIGKGAYGRVFKGKNRATNGLVAVKIIDIDKVDYEEMTTKNLQETLKEINILQQLKDSRARPYVNIIEEARTVHNELWIISEYASGGSVNTLMKPRLQLSKAGLEEKYIIPIARELALGLKFIHEAGVIHRDLKCNNILVLEDGRVQLCDFGVSGSLEPEIAKRSTIVGTPFWMAPELQKEWVKEADPTSRVRPNEILYGSEVDIWAYGCTIYEMATGYPPFHERQIFSLPEAGVPVLQGDKYSDELKSFVASVLQPNPRDRPAPDQILEHPYVADSTKMYPTVTLVALVEQYYRWEYAGGSRVSLFNPYGAQAPDPLAPETEDEDEDWTFSTTDEFEKQFAGELSDPFMSDSSTEGFTMNAPPQDVDRFARLQATIREEQADRGKKRLDRLFDTNSTPYRLSAIDLDPRRPPSDLILRDFNPGAPNRETVIDLDFAAPTVADIPSIDLGEVPTVKARGLNRILREMDMEDEDEEERDSFDMDQTARRATRDWKFPSQSEQSNRRTVEWKFPTEPEQSNRRTVEWKFPTEPEQSNRRTVDWKFPGPDKTNRRTMEWTFDISMAEAAQDEPVPKLSRLSRRDPQELSLPMPGAPSNDNRQTRDFVFPMRDPAEGGSLSDQDLNFSSSPTLEAGFRPGLRHATTEPLGSFDDYPRINSAPESPLRTSMIDLDMAMVEDYRPSTSDSASTSTYTAGGDGLNGNPFDLEDQVQLSQQNNRTSYHMKSQSEPNHPIPGLLTPQTYDEQGYPTNLDPHHPSMHARGVSSASQVQSKPPPNNIGYRHLQRERERQHQQQPQFWDGWSHQEAFRIDESPPTSVSPATSASEEDTLDDRWMLLEKQISSSTRRTFNYRDRRRQNLSRESQDAHDSETPRSDAEDNYASDSYDQPLVPGVKRTSRVSMGPNGRPLLDFPVPRGPDPEILAGAGMGGLGDGGRQALSHALWKSTVELRDGLRASRDLLKSMRLADVTPIQEENEHAQGT